MYSWMVDYDLIVRAQALQKGLGTRVAAGFLRNRKVDLKTALWILGVERQV